VLIALPAWWIFGRGRDGDTPPSRAAQRRDKKVAVSENRVRPEIVTRIRTGDRAAFDTLYLQYAERLWAFAGRYVRSDEGAEDIVHDVFLAIWAKRATWEPLDIEAYLFRSVLNRALQLGRHGSVTARAATGLRDYRVATGVTESSDATAELQSDRAWLARVLAELPERARVAIRLRWYDEMSYAQIAQVLGISEDAARVYVRRALAFLRELVTRGDHSGPGSPNPG